MGRPAWVSCSMSSWMRARPSSLTSIRRERRLQRLLDAVRDHYAAPALVWGRCADPGGRYTGAKIAYQSFPDAARLRWLGVV